MIEHVWSVLCTKSLIDRTSNNVTLVEVLERLAGPAVGEEQGMIAVQADFVTLWSRSNLTEAARGRARMKIISPNGTSLGGSMPYDVDLTTFQRVRNTARLGALPFLGSGYHYFVVELEEIEGQWKQVAKVPVEIRLEVPVASEIASQPETSNSPPN